MKYVKENLNEKWEETNEVFGTWLRNFSVNKLRDVSKQTLKNIFGTLKIPYKLEVFNSKHYKWGKVTGSSQSVVITNVPRKDVEKIIGNKKTKILFSYFGLI